MEKNKKWISVSEVLILQELMRQQENEAFAEFTQFGAEKRFNLPYPGKVSKIPKPDDKE